VSCIKSILILSSLDRDRSLVLHVVQSVLHLDLTFHHIVIYFSKSFATGPLIASLEAGIFYHKEAGLLLSLFTAKFLCLSTRNQRTIIRSVSCQYSTRILSVLDINIQQSSRLSTYIFSSVYFCSNYCYLPATTNQPTDLLPDLRSDNATPPPPLSPPTRPPPRRLQSRHTQTRPNAVLLPNFPAKSHLPPCHPSYTTHTTSPPAPANPASRPPFPTNLTPISSFRTRYTLPLDLALPYVW
jgi:hypothetical protein